MQNNHQGQVNEHYDLYKVKETIDDCTQGNNDKLVNYLEVQQYSDYWYYGPTGHLLEEGSQQIRQESIEQQVCLDQSKIQIGLNIVSRIVLYSLNTNSVIPSKQKTNKETNSITPCKKRLRKNKRPLQRNHFSKAALRSYMQNSTMLRDCFITFLRKQKVKKGKPYIISEYKEKEKVEIIRINCDKFSKGLLKKFLSEGSQDNSKGMHVFLKKWIELQKERKEEKERLYLSIIKELEEEVKFQY